MKNWMLAVSACALSMSTLNAQRESTKQPVPLWPLPAPGAIGTADKDCPVLFPFVPDANGSRHAAIVICPGGGYAHHAMDHEGRQVAEWLAERGIAAFILRYRLPGDGYRHPVPLLDAQRAIRKIRSEASTWSVAPNRIGIMGFSAGGHLASSAGTHFQNPITLKDQGKDEIDSASCRPDFMILIYPVISMQPQITHGGSKSNLLGDNPSQELLDLMSNEKQITMQTPPTFLIHADDDKAVVPENSILFYEELRLAGVPGEMHIFLKGGHGFGMRSSPGPASLWPDLCLAWLEQMNLVSAAIVKSEPKLE